MPVERLCHMVKRADFDGYGFNLHSEKGKPGQYIGKVDEKSPAQFSGLRQGDRILQVNGTAIGNETHKQVVQRIKAIENEVRLLVIDPKDEEHASHSVVVESNKLSHKEQLKATSSPATAIAEINGASKAATSALNETDTAGSVSGPAWTVNNNNNNNNKNTDVKPASTTDVVNNNLDRTDSNGLGNGWATATPETVTLSSDTKTVSNVDDNSTTTSDHFAAGTAAVEASSASPSVSTAAPTATLNLPTTAAEMRALILSRKKYDPKNDTLDLRKKFEIVQNL